MKLVSLTIAPIFKRGDPAPDGYLAWHEWAAVQIAAGLKQRYCRRCKRYRFPQEKCAHA
jgi:hypothetical protein